MARCSRRIRGGGFRRSIFRWALTFRSRHVLGLLRATPTVLFYKKTSVLIHFQNPFYCLNSSFPSKQPLSIMHGTMNAKRQTVSTPAFVKALMNYGRCMPGTWSWKTLALVKAQADILPPQWILNNDGIGNHWWRVTPSSEAVSGSLFRVGGPSRNIRSGIRFGRRDH
jgi:hypothetical protein